MDLKQEASKFGFVSKIKLIHKNLKSPDMGDLDKLLYYLWLCELQKWLREVYGFHVQPQKTFHNKTYVIGKIPLEFRILGKGCDDSYGSPISYTGPIKGKFKTYEEALEIGL